MAADRTQTLLARLKAPERARYLFCLFFLEAIAFGPFVARLGFYLDDWPLLETMTSGGRWGAIGAWIRQGGLRTRPVEIPLYSLFYFAGHLAPFAYHLLLFALCLSEGWLLFLLLDEILGSTSFAFCAAALTTIHPNRAVFYVWFSNSPQPFAHVLLLFSFLFHLRWRDRRGAGWLIGSLSLYLCALLSYESITFMPLLLGAAISAREYLRGTERSAALRQGIYVMLPYAVPMALGLGWQWFGMKLLLHLQNPKSAGMAISAGHILKAYGAGFECVFNRTLHVCAKGFIAAMKEFGIGSWAVLLASAGAFFWIVPNGEWTGPVIPLSVTTAVSVFIAGYAPYALSGTYMPQINGVMSRTNGLGAWASALFICALSGLTSVKTRRVILTLVIAAFIWTDWTTNSDWVRAWNLEKDILEKVVPQAERLPAHATVLLEGSPHFAGYAPVLDGNYDFSAALRITTGRPDLQGQAVGLRFDWPNARPLFAYHYDQDQLEPIAP